MVGTHKRTGLSAYQLLLDILMFFYIYTFSIPGLPTFVTTWRLSLIAMIVLSVIMNRGHLKIRLNNSDKCYLDYVKWISFLTCYTLVLFCVIGRGTGDSAIDMYINVIVFMPLFLLTIKDLYGSTESLMKSFLHISIFQIIIILGCTFIPAISDIVNQYININTPIGIAGKLGDLAGKGYWFGMACMTATGVFQLSLGIISCFYFMIHNRGNNGIYFAFLFLIGIVSVLISRTGIVLLAVTIYVYLIAIGKVSSMKALKFLGYILALAIILIIVVYAFGLQEKIQVLFSRVYLLIDNGVYEGFFRWYFKSSNSILPPVTAETLIGTGITSGTSGNGITIRFDGGFAKSYVAMGLILAVINYLIIIIQYKKSIKGLSTELRWVSLLFILFFFLGEFKEGLTWRFYYLPILFVMQSISIKSSREEDIWLNINSYT